MIVFFFNCPFPGRKLVPSLKVRPVKMANSGLNLCIIFLKGVSASSPHARAQSEPPRFRSGRSTHATTGARGVFMRMYAFPPRHAGAPLRLSPPTTKRLRPVCLGFGGFMHLCLPGAPASRRHGMRDRQVQGYRGTWRNRYRGWDSRHITDAFGNGHHISFNARETSMNLR